MDKRLEQRINELGEIVNKTKEEEVTYEDTITAYSMDGHNDAYCHDEHTTTITTHVYSPRQRKQAIKELKRLGKIKDQDIKHLVSIQLESQRKARRKSLNKGLAVILTLGVIACAAYLPIRGCIREGKEREGDDKIYAIQAYDDLMQENLREGLKDSAERNRNLLEYSKNSFRKGVNSGEILISEKSYQALEKYFSNEDWWPKNSNTKL